MDLNTELRRGEIAASLLDNEIYKEAIQSVQDGIVHAWSNSPIRDKEGQSELRLMLKLLTDLQRNIETVMQTGKLAKIQIERESLLTRTANRFR